MRKIWQDTYGGNYSKYKNPQSPWKRRTERKNGITRVDDEDVVRPGMKIIYKHYLQNTQKIYTSRLGDDEKGSVVSKW